MYDEIPFNCSSCGEINMVNMLSLEERPFSPVIKLMGYECSNCGGWETVSIKTAALDDLYNRIARAKPGSTKFQKLVAKAIQKQENLMSEVMRELRHGESKHIY